MPSSVALEIPTQPLAENQGQFPDSAEFQTFVVGGGVVRASSTLDSLVAHESDPRARRGEPLLGDWFVPRACTLHFLVSSNGCPQQDVFRIDSMGTQPAELLLIRDP